MHGGHWPSGERPRKHKILLFTASPPLVSISYRLIMGKRIHIYLCRWSFTSLSLIQMEKNIKHCPAFYVVSSRHHCCLHFHKSIRRSNFYSDTKTKALYVFVLSHLWRVLHIRNREWCQVSAFCLSGKWSASLLFSPPPGGTDLGLTPELRVWVSQRQNSKTLLSDFLSNVDLNCKCMTKNYWELRNLHVRRRLIWLL